MSIKPSNPPTDNLALRETLFAGGLHLAKANTASTLVVEEVRQAIVDQFGITDIRTAHLQISDEDFFAHMGELRRLFYLDPHYLNRLREILTSYGFDPERCAFDPFRIRVILPGGHRNPKAAPVYYSHRDTWYSHPQSLIVAWLPLHDLTPEETFHFYPDYFDKEVPNDSQIFDYSDWIKDGPALKIGWQKSDSGVTGGYPRGLEKETPAKKIGFSCKAGETLFFSGSQFHQTREQDLGTIRFNLDFRIVHLDDEVAKRGAPNVDNRSQGNILADYIHPTA